MAVHQFVGSRMLAAGAVGFVGVGQTGFDGVELDEHGGALGGCLDFQLAAKLVHDLLRRSQAQARVEASRDLADKMRIQPRPTIKRPMPKPSRPPRESVK